MLRTQINSYPKLGKYEIKLTRSTAATVAVLVLSSAVK